MNAQEIVDTLNKGNVRRQDIAELMEVSPNTITRIIAAGGFKYDNSAKKYVFGEAKKETTNQQKSEPRKQPTNPGTQEPTQETTNVYRKRASFDLDRELLKEYKIRAAQADIKIYELVEAALKEYIK